VSVVGVINLSVTITGSVEIEERASVLLLIEGYFLSRDCFLQITIQY
jgi:hypothetical protein